jgi:hypothetical protein
VEGLLDYSFRRWLQIDTKDHPMMVCEPTFNTPDRRAPTSVSVGGLY